MVLYRQESIWMVAELREGGREKEEGEGRCVVILPANFQIPGKKRGGGEGGWGGGICESPFDFAL